MLLHPNAALIAVDVQQGFDLKPWGPRNNPAMEANGLSLLAAWRAAGRPLVHTRHNSVNSSSPLWPGQQGNEFKPGFEPQAGELVVPKTVNSAFIGTDLEAWLRRASIGQLVLFGIASDMCVSTTARMAANLGFETIVVGDACYTWGQTAPDGNFIDGDAIHIANLTTLHSEFARVVTTAEIIAAPELRLAS